MLIAAACLALAAPADLHTDELHGFAIDVPDGWRTSSQQLDGGTFALQVLPPGSIGDRAVTVTVAPAEGRDAAAVVREVRARVEDPGADTTSGFEEWPSELAGRPAPGLRVRATAPSGEYQLVQSYLVEDGRVYMVQRHAPADAYDAHADALEAVAATFALVERGEAALEEERLLALAARCGSEVAWADGWAAAAERARAERKPVLVAAYLVPGFAITDTPRTSTFVDRDVIELVEERYVPLWYERGLDAPFVASYGLGPSSFGQALLVVTPDGDVVAETHAASAPDVALAFLRATLERLPDLAGAPPAEDLPPRERAARRVARGEHAAARALLEGDDSAEGHLLRATMLRREHRGGEALAALEEASAAGAERGPRLVVLEAQLRARAGELERAREMLDGVIAAHPLDGDGEAAGVDAAREAALVRGLLDLPAARDAAKARWLALTRAAPESRWAWQAAAALRSTLLDVDVTPDLGWPDARGVAEILAGDDPAPLPPERAGEAADGALAWLLANQAESGAWGGPTELKAVEGMGPNPFRDATAALAGSALLRRADDPAAERAARRALAFLLDSVAARAEEPPLVLFMDYVTWSDAMILRFVADALEHGLGDVEALAPVVDVLVADMAGRQRTGGGWSYYATSDLAGDAAPENSISFTTAAAILALARAREVGFDVPDDVLAPAVDALERMREDDGTFAYFLFHDSGQTQSGTPAAGAVGRGPACELALLAAGRSDRARVAEALERFLAQRHLFAAEQGKVVMHAGPDGQGSHYLLFDYAHAAFARELLGPDPRSRTKIAGLVLGCRQADGAFLDTPILGRAYGTAMALAALDALAE